MTEGLTCMNETGENIKPSENHIAFCAHQLWEHEGQPVGRESIHWIEAENQLLAGYVHQDWYQPNVAA